MILKLPVDILLRFIDNIFLFFMPWWTNDDCKEVRLKRVTDKLLFVLVGQPWYDELKDKQLENKSLWFVGLFL